MVHCDDRLKHDRLLTLIKLFEYRNTGTKVLLVHDNILLHKTYRVQQFMCIQQFAWFSHNPIQTCFFYIYILYIDNSQ